MRTDFSKSVLTSPTNPDMNKIILVALACAPLGASAATLLTTDFDTVFLGYDYAYVYQETGSGSHNDGVITGGQGTAGSAGLLSTFDTTNISGNFAGIGTGFGGNQGSFSSISDAASLADLSYTLDSRADGLTGSTLTVRFELKFEAPDNTILPVDGDGNTDILLRLHFDTSLTTTFQTFSSSLDSWVVDEGSLAQVQTYLGSMNNINLNIAHDANGALPQIGNDSNNVIAADNYTLSAVPEPGSVSLGLVAMVGLLARRQRRR